MLWYIFPQTGRGDELALRGKGTDFVHIATSQIRFMIRIDIHKKSHWQYLIVARAHRVLALNIVFLQIVLCIYSSECLYKAPFTRFV